MTQDRMEKLRKSVSRVNELLKEIPDDLYNPYFRQLVELGQEVLSGKWIEVEQETKKEPIRYDCTLEAFTEQLGIPLWKAMSFGKYFKEAFAGKWIEVERLPDVKQIREIVKKAHRDYVKMGQHGEMDLVNFISDDINACLDEIQERREK
jgi:hypothetical protein